MTFQNSRQRCQLVAFIRKSYSEYFVKDICQWKGDQIDSKRKPNLIHATEVAEHAESMYFEFEMLESSISTSITVGYNAI